MMMIQNDELPFVARERVRSTRLESSFSNTRRYTLYLVKTSGLNVASYKLRRVKTQKRRKKKQIKKRVRIVYTRFLRGLHFECYDRNDMAECLSFSELPCSSFRVAFEWSGKERGKEKKRSDPSSLSM